MIDNMSRKSLLVRYVSNGDRIQLKEAMSMEKKVNVFARVEPELKAQVESVLD